MEQENSRDWGAQWRRHFLARFPSSMSGKIALSPNSSCALEEAGDRGFSLSLFFLVHFRGLRSVAFHLAVLRLGNE